MTRFWSRYNVLLGIQVATVIAVLKPILDSEANVAWAAYTFLALLSFVTSAIVVRSIDVFKYNLLAIKKFELLNDEVYLFSSLTEELKKDNIEADFSSPRMYQFALIITAITFLAWTVLLVTEIYNIYQVLFN